MSRRTRLGLALVVIGIFVPLLGLPLAVGGGAGNLVEDFRLMHIALRQRKEVPVFRETREANKGSDATVVQYGDTGLVLEFGPEVSKAEIERAIQTRFPNDHLLPTDPQSGRLRFLGWSTVREALVLPIRYLVVAGLLLSLAGALVVILRGAPATDQGNA